MHLCLKYRAINEFYLLIKKIIAGALIISHIRYCAQVYLSLLNKAQTKKINNIIKSAACLCKLMQA